MKTLLVLAVTSFISIQSYASTLIIANKSDDTIDIVSLRDGSSLATLDTGHAPHEVAVSPDGRTAVVTNYGDRSRPGSSLTVIDLREGKITSTIQLGEHTRPHGIVFVDAQRLAVTAEGSAHLLIVDLRESAITSAIPTSQQVSHMVAVTSDGKRAFVANIGSGSVTAIDLTAGEKLADIETGAGAEGIAIHPETGDVWVTNRSADTLSVIDSQSLRIKATIACAGFPIRIAFTPDGAHALVSAARSGEVVLLDAITRKELLRAKLDLTNAPDAVQRLFGDQFGDSPVPVGLVIAPDGKTAWVAATQSDAVVAIDPLTLEVRDILRAGREPDGMAFAP
jgi:YVTN family beta-propeller protein